MTLDDGAHFASVVIYVVVFFFVIPLLFVYSHNEKVMLFLIIDSSYWFSIACAMNEFLVVHYVP